VAKVIFTMAHQKHSVVTKPVAGQFNRNELAILGTPCGKIRNLANQLTDILSRNYKVAYIDADHKAPQVEPDAALSHGACMELTDRISYRSIHYQQQFNTFENRMLFNSQDLVLVNGNHFIAHSQIIIIDPAKPLEKKLDKLTDVKLILLTENVTEVPEFLKKHIPVIDTIPVLNVNDTPGIVEIITNYLINRMPILHGLVLAGGKSERMQADKGSIAYHGRSQRLHVHQMLNAICQETFVSYASEHNIHQEEQLPVITDSFTGLGPFGGILSAFRSNPNVAWLTVACDLPYLSASTLNYLVQHRNPSKIATAFMDADQRFPEPLVTIWEPRSYLVLLQFLSLGYSCPRKVLINADIALLQAPQVQEFINVNNPSEKEAVLQQLKEQGF